MSIGKTLIERDKLFEDLAQGVVVVTANARLSRSLLTEFDQRQLAQGRTAWPTPTLLPLAAWLLERFTEASLAADLPRLLTEDQERQVWAAIVRRDGDALLRIEATARRAAEAWKLLREWRLDLRDPRFALNENVEAFRRWALAFHAQCVRREQVSEADITRLLLPLLEDGVCALPPRLLLVGFYELNPEQRAMVEGLRNAGCAADWVGLRGRQGRARRFQAEDPAAEMAAAVKSARQILEAEPRARVGIVVPDLGDRRMALEHLLTRTLDPEALRPGSGLRPRPWNISLGRPLSAWPVVRAAGGLLGLTRGSVDIPALCELLASPHWALPAEPNARRAAVSRRALLDARLRRRGDAVVRLSSLMYLASQHDDEGVQQPWCCPHLAARLDALLGRARDLPQSASAATWAAEFAAWLRAAGWAGSANGGEGGGQLDSHEHQTVDAWNQVLSRLASLEDYAGALSLSAALSLLDRMAAETVFQPRGGDAAVQVLGLYEASGLVFDHLWVMGLHDAAWPQAPAPHPFLPLALQRERGLPHCDPGREYAWAVELMADLTDAARDVVFSYAAREGAEERAPSPLLHAYEATKAAGPGVEFSGGWCALIRASVEREPLPAAPPIPLARSASRGGSRLFLHQAACPFRAYVEHRLGARPLDGVRAGLDPARRGVLLHAALESLWRDLLNHANLVALDQSALRERVRAHIAAVIENEQKRSPLTMTARYCEVEAAGLEEKLLAWLDVERQRAPFRVVASEEPRDVEIGGIRMRIVIDRVDELEDGGRVVLDYKTGKVRPSGWFGERPDDSQLPVYGVVSAAEPTASGPGVAAVAFAQIRPDAVGFSGVVREHGILPGLPITRKGPLQEATAGWPGVLDEWKAVLEGLAGEFRAGHAAVDPKGGVKTCRETYCELAALCRIGERMGNDGYGAATGEGGDD